MSEKMMEMSCGAFAAALASKAPVPGGGGASALVAALGASLCTMVGNYTVGKKKYAGVEEEVRVLMTRAEEIRLRLSALVEEDAAAFAPLSEAYAVPKDDPAKGEIMERCLRAAAAPPMEILRLSGAVIELHQAMLAKGSVLMLSDVGTGVVFAWAALYGAALNVKVNTNSMADRAYAEELNNEVDRLMNEHWRIADQVYEAVLGRFS